MHTRCEWEAPLTSHMKVREAAPLCLAGLSDQAMPLQLTALGKEILILVSAPGSTLWIPLLKKSSWSHPSLVLSFPSPESALSKKAQARLMGIGNGGSQTPSPPKNCANTSKFNCLQGWTFSMKFQPHVLIFIYASLQQKPKQGEKNLREAKQTCFEGSSQTWHEIRWIQKRVEPSLPLREIPLDARPSPPSRWKSGVPACRGKQCSSPLFHLRW